MNDIVVEGKEEIYFLLIYYSLIKSKIISFN
jgi:hypothetical protein